MVEFHQTFLCLKLPLVHQLPAAQGEIQERAPQEHQLVESVESRNSDDSGKPI